MGMFDELRAINITHEKFDRAHNGLRFQTKDIECQMFDYCVFNGVLYIEAEYGADGYKRHDKAVKSHHTGEVNIYTDLTTNDIEYWIEYDLMFENGVLIDVVAHEPAIKRNRQDKASRRPCLPRNRVLISINIDNCEAAKREAVMGKLTIEKINAIRELLDEPLATVSYPAKCPNGSIYPERSNSNYRTALSTVQTPEDMQFTKDGSQATIQTPRGDCVVIDEYWQFLNKPNNSLKTAAADEINTTRMKHSTTKGEAHD